MRKCITTLYTHIQFGLLTRENNHFIKSFSFVKPTATDWTQIYSKYDGSSCALASIESTCVFHWLRYILRGEIFFWQIINIYSKFFSRIFCYLYLIQRHQNFSLSCNGRSMDFANIIYISYMRKPFNFLSSSKCIKLMNFI